MASRGWISRDPVGRTYSGSNRRVSREGVRQQGTQMGAPGIDFGAEFGIGSPSVQLPASATEKWGGLAGNQDVFGSQMPQMLDADPGIARFGTEVGANAAQYGGLDAEMAFSGAGPTVNTAATDYDAPLKSDFSEFDGIKDGRLGKALAGAQDNIIAYNSSPFSQDNPEFGTDAGIKAPTFGQDSGLNLPNMDPDEFKNGYMQNLGGIFN